MDKGYLRAQEIISKAISEKLGYIDLSFLSLTEVPQEIGELEWLYEINLSHNFLSRLPDTFRKLKRLQVLDLSYNFFNGIESLPFDTYDNLSIQEIDISNNNIQKFPNELFNLDYLEEVYLENNPVQNKVPLEIWTAGFTSISNYLDAIEISHSTKKLYELKLILIGDGDVGKTTLAKKLIDPLFEVEIGKEPTTHGIFIEEWEIDCPLPVDIEDSYFDDSIYNYSDYEDYEDYGYDDQGYRNDEDDFYNDYHSQVIENQSSKHRKIDVPIKLNVWDFGGQEIYRSTHQFFLTKRSIYIFVWEARKDTDYHGFEKWLNTIKYLSSGSPVIVVMNKSESRIQSIDESNLKKLFPNIVKFLQVSCVDNIGVSKVKDTIISIIPNLQHIGIRLAKTWFELKNALKYDSRDFISCSEFYKISAKYGLNEKQANFISEYLHDLGVILHFQADRFLNNVVILKPEWVTKSVYALIDNQNVQKGKGKFTYEILQNTLDSKVYPSEIHHNIVRLMEKFELCFNIIGTDDYILAELLPIGDAIFDSDHFSKSPDIRLDIVYNFMPSGILTRLICRMHPFVNKENFWKNWIEFKYEGSNGLILQDVFEKKLSIFISGNDSSDLLALIRSNLDQIHDILNFRRDEDYSETMPCNCSICIDSSSPNFFKYNILKRYIDKKKEFITCPISVEDVTINELLKKYTRKSPKKKMIHEIIIVCSQLQGQRKSVVDSEDARNNSITNALTNRGVIAKDQSRWGKSATGKNSGELDIKIESELGVVENIFEGYNLKNWDSEKIRSHYEKIFDYDANGLKENYLVGYVSSDKFLDLWRKYLSYIPSLPIQYPIDGTIEDVTNLYECGTDIKIGLSKHKRQGRIVNLYHIFVLMLS